MFLLLLNQVLKMCMILVLGFICFKTGLVDAAGSRTLSNLLLLVVNPILVFQSFLSERDPALIREFGRSALIALSMHLIMILLSVLIFRRKSDPKTVIEKISVVYTNCGFMGIPLINALYGSRGVFFLTPYMMVFNVLLWTHALVVMTGKADARQLRRGLTTPVMFAMILGLVLLFSGWQVPALANDTLTYISSMNTPLAMLIAGISLAQSSLGKMFKNPGLYLVTFIRLVFFPLVLLLIFFRIPVSTDLLIVNLIAGACPAATSCMMFALRYEKDYKYASQIFAFTTVISMATIPVYAWLLERIML